MDNEFYDTEIEQEKGEYAPEDYEAEAYEHKVEEESTQHETPKYSPIPPEPEKKPEKAFGGMGRLIAVALVCSLLGGMCGAGITAALTHGNTPSNSTQSYVSERDTAVVDPVTVPAAGMLTDTQIYAQNAASTVGITTSVTTNFWGFTTTAAASGSGIVYTADGYILTNYHVVENSNSITVTTYDDQSYDAVLLGYDESNDIAVLKVEAEGLQPAVIGSSDALMIGDHVVAIGNPLGELTFSLTQGAVSSLDRRITLSNGTSMKLIQTDCAINSGNSGGALFNAYGEVIGITNAKYSSSSSGASVDNIGFAIPINSVLDKINSIIERGYVAKPFIGVTVSTVSAEAQQYGLPAGAAVQEITEGGPAAKAGLRKNDIITSVNGNALETHRDLVEYVGGCTPGDELVLEIYRAGEILSVSVTVDEQHQTASAD